MKHAGAFTHKSPPWDPHSTSHGCIAWHLWSKRKKEKAQLLKQHTLRPPEDLTMAIIREHSGIWVVPNPDPPKSPTEIARGDSVGHPRYGVIEYLNHVRDMSHSFNFDDFRQDCCFQPPGRMRLNFLGCIA